MEKYLVLVLNVLIKEGYTFVTIKDFHPTFGSHRRYRLVNQRTSCAVMITEDGIDISLCSLEDVANKSYASERRVTVECAEDFPAAEELILRFEDWCDEDSYYEE